MADEFDDDAEAVVALDEALASEATPEDCMQLSELDGFLTGLAVAPQKADPSEWLTWVWGGEFADRDEQARVTAMVMDHFARIASDIAEGYGVDPLFWEDDEGNVEPGDWADGFMAAVDLAPEAWLPILEDDEARMHMVPILALANDEDGQPLLRLDDNDVSRLVAEAETVFPQVVEEINSFWKGRQG